MHDFTLKSYKNLILSLQQQAFTFLPFREFITSSTNKVLCLRQDVDLLHFNSLEFAQMQSRMGIRGTYYFRAVKESWNERVIEEIAELGHEVGYHYEDLSLASKIKARDKQLNLSRDSGELRVAGDEFDAEALYALAIESFEKNLEALRKIVPVTTICMHGSPMSKYDSKELWKYYDYRDFGIKAEPYFGIDFSKVLYLTDTGRKWNGDKVSVRDGLRVAGYGLRGDDPESLPDTSPQPATCNPQPFSDWKVKPPINSSMNMTKKAIDFQNQYNFRSTYDIIQATEEGNLPDKIMMTFHPQRWTDKPGPWVKELVWQNTKNVAKYFLIKFRS